MNTRNKKNIGFIGVILGFLCLEACTVSVATAWKNKGDFTQNKKMKQKSTAQSLKQILTKKKIKKMKSKMFRAVLVKEDDLEYWIIASGAFKASEMKFKTKKQAEDYINKIDWGMVVTAISQVLNFNEQKNKK